MTTAPIRDGHLDRALELLGTAPLIDGHNDLAIALRHRVGGIGVSKIDLRKPIEGLDTDIPRLRAGRVGGQFWSVVGSGRPAGGGRAADGSRAARHRRGLRRSLPRRLRPRDDGR